MSKNNTNKPEINLTNLSDEQKRLHTEKQLELLVQQFNQQLDQQLDVIAQPLSLIDTLQLTSDRTESMSINLSNIDGQKLLMVVAEVELFIHQIKQCVELNETFLQRLDALQQSKYLTESIIKLQNAVVQQPWTELVEVLKLSTVKYQDDLRQKLNLIEKSQNLIKDFCQKNDLRDNRMRNLEKLNDKERKRMHKLQSKI